MDMRFCQNIDFYTFCFATKQLVCYWNEKLGHMLSSNQCELTVQELATVKVAFSHEVYVAYP
jgi:hypothetical protein